MRANINGHPCNVDSRTFEEILHGNMENITGENDMATPLETDWPAEQTPPPEKVKISKVHNGFIVEVGCVTAVFNTDKEMMKELNLYWKDPVKAEEEWTKKQ